MKKIRSILYKNLLLEKEMIPCAARVNQRSSAWCSAGDDGWMVVVTGLWVLVVLCCPCRSW